MFSGVIRYYTRKQSHFILFQEELPKENTVVDELLKSAAGKILKKGLKKRVF